jgi:Na+/proline symporter
MIIAATVLIYFTVLWSVSRLTARQSSNEAFFRAERKSPWYMVAFGMIGASISGVSCISVPGMPVHINMYYLQMCLGFILGYFAIAYILLPIYYKLNLTTIYSYLRERLGIKAYKTGASFFLLSKMTRAAVSFYVVCMLLQRFVFEPLRIPFFITVVGIVALIWLYTHRGGVKTLVWTDTFQTFCLFGALILIIWQVANALGLSLSEAIKAVKESPYSQVFLFDDWLSKQNFWKQFLSGIFVVIVMTGLDQDMMQKNLTCKNLRDAQKNVMTSSGLFIVVNIIFLSLGAALIYYAQQTGFALPVNANGVVVNDKIFPSVAFSLSTFTAVVFVLGLVAAGYSSADGTLTALTTTFCFDFLHFEKKGYSEQQITKYRKLIHVAFALLYLLVIILFRPFHNESLIDKVFDIAGLTYGPLLGLYTFGLFVKNRKVNDKAVPYIAIASPVISYLLKTYSAELLWGYHFGFEILIVNGLLTFAGLMIASKKEGVTSVDQTSTPDSN